jgi:hypothetical protein
MILNELPTNYRKVDTCASCVYISSNWSLKYDWEHSCLKHNMNILLFYVCDNFKEQEDAT